LTLISGKVCKYVRAISELEKTAQCKGVHPISSVKFKSKPKVLKNKIGAALSPYAAT